jgi:hypothetical protein
VTVDGVSSETPRSSNCLNCGAPLSGPFCAQCGQRDVPPYPSVRELAVDAFWELSGWDGRFASTVRALFRHPGILTREFLEGRRARYISPLRLYLMSSLVYFLLAAAAPNVNLGKKSNTNFAGVQGSGFKIGTDAPKSTAAARVGDAASRSMAAARNKDNPDLDSLTAAKRDSIMKEINLAPAIFRPILRRAVADSKGLQRSITESMPRMLFALLPVFAAILALFYRRRKYPEHLYFAIHLHAFVFLTLALIEVAKFTRSAPLVKGAGMLALLWIPIYSTIALRRTYGGSIARTLAKETGIGLIYAFAGVVGFMTTVWLISVVA